MGLPHEEGLVNEFPARHKPLHSGHLQPRWDMDLTLKNLPEVLFQHLRAAAASRSCSVEALILLTLEKTFGEPTAERRILLARIRRHREAQTLWLDDAALAFARKHGRE